MKKSIFSLSLLVVLLSFAPCGYAYEVKKFDVPGRYLWTVPEGVTEIYVSAAGAGGDGDGVVVIEWAPQDIQRKIPKKDHLAPNEFSSQGIHINTQGGSVHLAVPGYDKSLQEKKLFEGAKNLRNTAIGIPIPLLQVGGPAVRFPELAPNGKPIWRKLIDIGLIRKYFNEESVLAEVPLSRFTQISYKNIDTRCINPARSWVYYTQPEYALFHGEKRPLGGSWTTLINGRVETLDLNVIWGYLDSILISAHPGTHHAMVVVCLEYTLKSDPVVDVPVFFRNDGAWIREDGTIILDGPSATPLSVKGSQ